MDIAQLDRYVLKLLEANGWYAGRWFAAANDWIAEIEGRGYRSFALARQILCELGGLSFREYAPLTYQKMIELRRKEGKKIAPGFAADIKAACESRIRLLQSLAMEDQAEDYSGATFAFDALSAARDDEIVLELETVKGVVGEPLFPIGAAAPDGMTLAGGSGKIYTVFNDSVYLSGESIEAYLNMMFLKALKPTLLYQTSQKGRPSS